MVVIVTVAVVLVLALIFVGYMVAAVRFVRRHPSPDHQSQRHSMGNSITGFWRYVLREPGLPAPGKDRRE